MDEVTIVQQPPKKKIFFRRWWFWLIAVVIVIASIAAYSRYIATPANTTGTTQQTESEMITVKNIQTRYIDGNTSASGKVTNNDSVPHSFSVTISFFDSNKKLLGTAVGSVDNLAPAKTEKFTAVGPKECYMATKISTSVQMK